MDPHGAVGYLGLKKYQEEHPERDGIFLETAHPAKFGDIVQDTIGAPVDIPDRLAEYMKREKRSIILSNRFEEFKEYMMSI